MMIETRTLRYFVAVAEELHFGRAAARLNIVQPALSAQIKSLESRLGTTLLLRTRQNVSLSETGMVFLEEARKALTQIEHAEAIGRRAASGLIGLLRVGYVGSAPFGTLMPRTIANYRRAYPTVEVRLEELSVATQLERLTGDTLDVGFVRLPLPFRTANLVVANRSLERIVVALPGTHRLAAQRKIELTDLHHEDFITASAQDNAGLSNLFWRVCTEANFIPRIVQTTPHITAILSLVGAGLGIALVPESISGLGIEGTVYRPLAGKQYILEAASVSRKDNNSPLLRHFLRELTKCSESCSMPSEGRDE